MAGWVLVGWVLGGWVLVGWVVAGSVLVGWVLGGSVLVGWVVSWPELLPVVIPKLGAVIPDESPVPPGFVVPTAGALVLPAPPLAPSGVALRLGVETRTRDGTGRAVARWVPGCRFALAR